MAFERSRVKSDVPAGICTVIGVRSLKSVRMTRARLASCHGRVVLMAWLLPLATFLTLRACHGCDNREDCVRLCEV